MVITSGFDLEGYDILSYIGHESAAVVMGTGFLSSTKASVSDFLGTTSSSYENKLSQGTSIGKTKLVRKAMTAGGNAIIGFDVDYTTFSNDVMGIIVSGTIVKIGKKVPERVTKDFIVPTYNLKSQIRCSECSVINVVRDEKLYIRLVGKNYSSDKLDALKASFKITTIFNDELTTEDILFAEIDKREDSVFETEYNQLDIDYETFKILKNVEVYLNQYVMDGNIVDVDRAAEQTSEFKEDDLVQERNAHGIDAVCTTEKGNESWKCYCGYANSLEDNICHLCGRKIDLSKMVFAQDYKYHSEKFVFEEHVSELNACKTATEIIDYLQSLSCGDKKLWDEIIPEVKKIAAAEKMFGSMKDSAVKKIEDFYL